MTEVARPLFVNAISQGSSLRRECDIQFDADRYASLLYYQEVDNETIPSTMVLLGNVPLKKDEASVSLLIEGREPPTRMVPVIVKRPTLPKSDDLDMEELEKNLNLTLLVNTKLVLDAEDPELFKREKRQALPAIVGVAAVAYFGVTSLVDLDDIAKIIVSIGSFFAGQFVVVGHQISKRLRSAIKFGHEKIEHPQWSSIFEVK